ncbi:hypothetical protein ACFL21_04545 [Patescibacteria group bacterium]
MKESARSIKILFYLVGGLNLLAATAGIFTANLDTNTIIAVIVTYIIGITLIYFGIKTSHYLKHSPKVLQAVVIIFTCISIIGNSLRSKFGIAIIMLVIGAYLINNIRKLSQEPELAPSE